MRWFLYYNQCLETHWCILQRQWHETDLTTISVSLQSNAYLISSWRRRTNTDIGTNTLCSTSPGEIPSFWFFFRPKYGDLAASLNVTTSTQNDRELFNGLSHQKFIKRLQNLISAEYLNSSPTNPVPAHSTSGDFDYARNVSAEVSMII